MATDVLEPPPRVTGDPASDVLILLQWIESFYRNFILERGVVLSVHQPAATINNGVIQPFPVGAVFISILDTDPSELLGYGTWESIGSGKTLIGLDASDTDFNALEKTGGAKAVLPAGTLSAPTFTGTPLGTHTHAVTTHGATTGADFDAVTALTAASAGTPAGTVSAPVFTGSPSSVVQPYLTVSIWKRTA